MSQKTDTYKTLSKVSEPILFKEKKSKFFGYAYPVQTIEEIKPIIESLKKKHQGANHVCYAWQLGIDEIQYRANDDGEPNNSAGMPIYGQIKAFSLTNTLVAVVRIFGGTKLGVGGLISAYREAAKLALETSTIIEKVQKLSLHLSFEYIDLDFVMRVIKQQQLEIQEQNLEENCTIQLLVPKSDFEKIQNIFESKHTIQVKENNS